jgi:hypothetical protein
MPTVVQFRRGTTAQNNSFTGAAGELSVDTTLGTIRVHNGIAGGNTLASVDAVQTLSNKTLSAPTITGTLTASGSTGSNGQYLQSTSTGIEWATLVVDSAQIKQNASNVTATASFVNVAVNGSNTAAFSSQALSITGFLNVTGNVLASTLIGTLGTAAQTNITSVGALTDLTVNGNVTIGGNLFVNGNVVTINANNLSINDSMIYLADDNPADILDIGFVSAFTSAVRYQHTGFVRDATDSIWKLFANVVAEPTTTINFTGAIYAPLQVGNLRVTDTVTAIINAGTNGVGNIGATGATFNTVFAKASTAQYADLAEVYTSDKNYVPSTVLIFGGDQEVTISTQSHDPRIAGVVSTNPAYLMNDTETGVAVALTGRVPCQVLGPVAKGDRLVASQHPGIAQKLNPDLYEPGCIIGKALGSIQESSVKTIEVVVGRV